MKTGIAIFAHGSSVEAANEAVRAVTAAMARAGGFDLVEPAFLELAQPDLARAVETLVGRGATRILVIPYFLTLGIHLQRDLPRIVGELLRIHRNVRIHVTPPLDGHPALLDALLDRARDGLDEREILL
ncbi:MAG: sirohydrochlorin chelatase [Bryobacteraceae bacterium]